MCLVLSFGVLPSKVVMYMEEGVVTMLWILFYAYSSASAVPEEWYGVKRGFRMVFQLSCVSTWWKFVTQGTRENIVCM